MQTTYEIALNEFREASAAVRRAFGAIAEARELQIIADSQHRQASNAHAEAVARMERADAALQKAREGQQGTASAIAVQGALAAESAPQPRVTQADIDALGDTPPAPVGNGLDAQAAGYGIG